MGYKPKSDKPFPPPAKGELRDWAKKYFVWEQMEGENNSQELSKLGKEWENGHPDYVAPPAKGTDMVTMSRDEMQKMFSEIEERITAKVTSTPATAPQASSELKDVMGELADILNPAPGQRHRTKSEAEVDQRDFLDEPVMFFTYFNYYSIHSEKRYSHEVKTPYGRPIVFNNISGHVTGGARGGKATLQISAAQIQTKKELEWMKASPKFNVIFFEKIRDVINTDPHTASRLAQALSEVSAFTEYQVMQRALAAGISADTDAEGMRRKLIQLIAAQNIEQEKAVSRNAAVSSDTDPNAYHKRGLGNVTAPATAY